MEKDPNLHIKAQLVGSSVLTRYNNRHYRLVIGIFATISLERAKSFTRFVFIFKVKKSLAAKVTLKISKPSHCWLYSYLPILIPRREASQHRFIIQRGKFSIMAGYTAIICEIFYGWFLIRGCLISGFEFNCLSHGVLFCRYVDEGIP